jgi:hypothetical protein
MYSAGATPKLLGVGFPIRRSTDQRLLTAPRGLSQFCHVLHRLLVPRHPPNALTSLTTKTGSSRQPGAELPAARTRRQTVKSRSSFALHLRERVSLIGDRVRISQTQVAAAAASSRGGCGQRLGSHANAHPFECLLLASLQASERTPALGIRASRFVLLWSCHRTVGRQSPGSAAVGSSGPGKT